MKMDASNKFFTLGLVGSPFGLEGFVKVRPFSGETAHLSQLKTVKLKKGEKEEEHGIAGLIFREDASLLMRFAGIENPEAAALMKGSEIIVSREFAAPLKAGEFYVEDLKGLRVITSGTEAGVITDIIEGGGGYLAEIALPAGEKRLIPFRNEFLGDPDFKKGVITLLEPWILEQ